MGLCIAAFRNWQQQQIYVFINTNAFSLHRCSFTWLSSYICRCVCLRASILVYSLTSKYVHTYAGTYICVYTCAYLQVCSTSHYEAQHTVLQLLWQNFQFFAFGLFCFFFLFSLHAYSYINVASYLLTWLLPTVCVVAFVTVIVVAVVLEANCLFKSTEKLYYFALKVKSVLAVAVTNAWRTHMSANVCVCMCVCKQSLPCTWM